MKVTKTKLPGLLIVEPKVREDDRGFFMESYNQRDFGENGITEVFVQDNISFSRKGTLRGLHYQLNPHAQGKLVRVAYGSVFDVAVDIRRGSPTFGQWYGESLSAQNRRMIYVPPGFAHGFLVLSDEAEFTYKCTALYDPGLDRAIVWNDSEVGIVWPQEPDPTLLSARDRDAPALAHAEINFVYEPTQVADTQKY